MIILFERSTVADYGTWREAFAEFAMVLEKRGVLASTVYQSVDDPNDITVAHEFATLDEAKAFLDSQELKAARPSAGVTQTPTVWFTVRV